MQVQKIACFTLLVKNGKLIRIANQKGRNVMNVKLKLSQIRKAYKLNRPKKGKFKGATLYCVHLDDGHQVCGMRFVFAITGRKWATYFVPNANIQKRMKLAHWNALQATAYNL